MKPGWTTSEFWITLIGQGLSLLVLAGLITPGDSTTLGANLTKTITAVFTLLASARIVTQYIQSRTTLKARQFPDDTGRAAKTVLPLTLAALCCFSPGAIAQAPQRTTLLPWRRHVEERLRERNHDDRSDSALVRALEQIAENQRTIINLLQQRQVNPTPGAAPQVIMLSPPWQHLPLGGLPYQQVPLGGMPYQQIPLGGMPKQEVPLGTPPKQEVPLGSPPKQQIDPGTAPRQLVPTGWPRR